MNLILESSAFGAGADIPPRHTCDGDDLSPPLHWHGAPDGTVTFALIVEDPDAPAGTWVHWTLFGLPASATNLAEGASGTGTLPSGTVEGRNSWGRNGYGGPCPPSGTHRYFFRLYALDAPIGLGARADVAEVRGAMQGHVLAEAERMGRYRRPLSRSV
jgi:Raf kinase inhibitor-like YbhB/YbcL family protein